MWTCGPRYARQSVRDAARRHTVSHVSECPVVASGRAFRVELPDGRAYWTVVDEEYVRVAVADQFLFDLRFGRDRAGATTRVYAGELPRFPSSSRRPVLHL